MPQIPLWAYVLVPLLALTGGIYAGWVALKNAKATGNQVTLSDIINQLQEERNEDRTRITALEKLVRKSEEFERLSRKFMWQQDMWIVRVYNPSADPDPPVMPDALKPGD